METKKLLFFISMMLFAFACGAQESNKQKFKKLEWLVGTWTRTNAAKEKSGYETWSKVSELKLSGKGVTLQGGKAVFVENLEFVVMGADIFYRVLVTGEKNAVYFKLTALDKDGFTCENPTHDFPKKISYRRKGNGLNAIIEGGGQQVDYVFVRK